jgi:hypothetical protein
MTARILQYAVVRQHVTIVVCVAEDAESCLGASHTREACVHTALNELADLSVCAETNTAMFFEVLPAIFNAIYSRASCVQHHCMHMSALCSTLCTIVEHALYTILMIAAHHDRFRYAYAE